MSYPSSAKRDRWRRAVATLTPPSTQAHTRLPHRSVSAGGNVGLSGTVDKGTIMETNAEDRTVVKLSVNLPVEVVEALREMAAQRGTTMTETIRRAISTEKYLDDAQAEGAKILIQDPDQTVQRLVLR
jgi:hypothetical protein